MMNGFPFMKKYEKIIVLLFMLIFIVPMVIKKEK